MAKRNTFNELFPKYEVHCTILDIVYTGNTS